MAGWSFPDASEPILTHPTGGEKLAARTYHGKPRLSFSAGRRSKLTLLCYDVGMTTEAELIRRITADPAIFEGKPIIRGHRLAVEHVLAMLAAGDSPQDILDAYPFLDSEDIRACLLYAYKLVAHERIDPFPVGSAA